MEYEVKRTPMAVRIIVITLASFVMALNIKTFVRTGGIIPGGASGLTLLIQEIGEKYLNIEVPYSLINILINAVPVYIGFRYIGKRFTLLSCYVIVLSGILTDLIPFHSITRDTLLISIFGGLINGAAISACLLVDATSGGIDFISIYLSEKRGIDSFNITLIINGVILTAAGLLFGWEKAMYSIIFQYTSTSVIHVLYRKYQQATLFIVTTKPREVCATISRISNHGATILEGEGSYEHNEKSVVYSVVSSAEAGELVNEIKLADPAAFVNVLKTQRVIGRFYRRPED
ncbi:MAG: YitT family protein [Lachnospiraceae bacterium]|nr:YitT family protein [Lachnospiraceae bacterium]